MLYFLLLLYFFFFFFSSRRRHTRCALVTGVQTCALPIWPTGSGKTSTTALVHRFYDVWEGRVLVGGRDVRRVTQASLGRHIAMVLQEPFLFSTTIEENIRYANAGATRAEAAAAAKDRKGVGSGKSGSVRVDFGGARTSKKKN